MANQPKKYKKFVATAATATLVASAIVPVASAKSFSDVAENNEFQPFIDALSETGIINGYADGTFKPGANLTRGQVVKMLGRWVESNGTAVPTDWETVQRFNDVPVNSADQELVKYAALVKDAGVFTGSNGNLLAGNNITRQQMAKVLNGAYTAVNGTSLVDLADNIDNKLVTDLASAQQEFEGYIQALVDLEISTVSVFRPSENVTRAQFAKFLYNTINVEAVGAAGVKAINNTTVEVTFGEEISDIKALDFAIEGLEVKNAVVKQTDAKTAVLTTAAQEGGKEYTVSVNDEEVGSFTGITAVIPTKVELVSTSVQGKLGQQVTVQAKVTVAEGQSKAGIPVTFSIPGLANDAVYPTVTGEAYTNEEGIATYTYTRYGAGTDSVTAYATGDRSKFAVGYVFWGVEQILTVEEVTEGNTINNGANKTYKVTYKNATTGKPQAGVTLNVSALENINVTADKLQNVSINGVEVAQLSNSTVVRAAQITTDSKGEATFTVSGTNAEVTPVVFAASNEYYTTGGGVKTYDYKYDASDLQTTAAKVKFAAIQAEYTIELTRDGGEVAATGVTNGRVYKVLVKDKNGNVAKNETVNVAFNEDLDRVIATNTKAGFVNTTTETFYADRKISVKTNDKGEASFTIATADGNVNDYATPIAWIDINSSNAKDGTLDEGEPKTIAQITHFQAPYLDGAAIKAYKTTGGKATDKFDAGEAAEFKAELVNQSGKVFTGGYTLGNVTYTVFNTGAEDVTIDGKRISPNRSETFTKSNGGSLFVTSSDNKNTSVRVVATGIAYKDGKDFAFTAKEATATFTNSKSVVAPYTGYVTVFNNLDSGSNSNSLWFDGKDPIKYAGESGKTYKYFGANGNEIFGEAAWETYLTSLVNHDFQVSYSVDGDTKTFKVISAVSAPSSAKKLVTYTAPPAANNAPTAKVVGNQTVAVGSTLTLTSSQLAEDVDTGDVLTILAAYTGNATVATATTSGSSITITPVATGTTTVTAVVSDAAGASVTVTFNLTVTPTVYVSAVSGGNPVQAYAAATPTKAKATLPTFTSVAVGGDLEITDETGTAYNVALTAGQTPQQVSDAINTFATTYGVKVTSSVVNEKVEILSEGTGASITSLSVDGDGTLELASGTAFATSAATIDAGTAGTATPAKFAFKVATGVANGKEVDYKITIGSATTTVTVDATAGAKTVTDVVTALAAATLPGYTLTANGDVIEIVQTTASATSDKLVVEAEEQ